jgi:hypothetical protein
MLSLPQRSGTKVGAILYGLLAGISVVVVIVFGSFVLGVLGSWVHIYRLWDDSGEYQAWLPIIFGEYSIVPGLLSVP